MGAWGYGPWENDGNLDMLLEFSLDDPARNIGFLYEALKSAKKEKSALQLSGLIEIALISLGQPAGPSPMKSGDARTVRDWGKHHEQALWAFLAAATSALGALHRDHKRTYRGWDEPIEAWKAMDRVLRRAVGIQRTRAGVRSEPGDPLYQRPARKARKGRKAPAGSERLRPLRGEGTEELVRMGSAAARAELKKRGREPDGKKR